MKDCLEAGEQIYSADIFNYAVVRRADKKSHTWQASDNEVKRGAIKVGDGIAFDKIQA